MSILPSLPPNPSRQNGPAAQNPPETEHDWAASFEVYDTREESPLFTFAAGNAARVLRPAEQLEPGTRVVLACRVSHCDQNAHLVGQSLSMWEAVKGRGAVLVGLHAEVCSGWYPEWLLPGVRKARERGAVILVEAPNRAVRHQSFHSTERPELQANELNLRDLEEVLDGVAAYSVVPPGATWEVERSWQTARGLNYPVPASPRKHMQSLRPLALALAAAGYSPRGVARELRSLTEPLLVPTRGRRIVLAPAPNHTTIWRWLPRAGTGSK